MKQTFLTSEWNSFIPKSLTVFFLGVFILGIGIVWLLFQQKKESKKDITEIESEHNYWFRMEDNIDIWGLIIAGIITIIYSLLII